MQQRHLGFLYLNSVAHEEVKIVSLLGIQSPIQTLKVENKRCERSQTSILANGVQKAENKRRNLQVIMDFHIISFYSFAFATMQNPDYHRAHRPS